MENTPFKMRSGNNPSISELSGVSPIKAADQALVDAAGEIGDEAAETTRQMGENIARMISSSAKKKRNNDEEDNDDNEDNENENN